MQVQVCGTCQYGEVAGVRCCGVPAACAVSRWYAAQTLFTTNELNATAIATSRVLW